MSVFKLFYHVAINFFHLNNFNIMLFTIKITH